MRTADGAGPVNARDGAGLPIAAALPALRQALRTRTSAIVQAPPGAGKSTVVPLALLDEPWLAGRRILVLEPRRLAARAVAQWMAHLRGEPVGATVGYRMRLETRVGPGTRIEVLTEGVLTRMLQDDPALEAAGAVIFDEFHERNLHADLGLALCLDVQQALRPDLRLVLMSATLDAGGLAALLDRAPVIRAPGLSHPVEVRHARRAPGADVVPALARTVREALAAEPGDVLVFLPGAGEIRRTARLLAAPALPAQTQVLALYGDLDPAQQDRAIAPAAPGQRKIVLATSIAETSLTIEGVRVVVDAGLARRTRFDPRSGMSRLVTTRVSRAEAEQRRGRAGRLAPGVCYRLWTAERHAALAEQPPAEIDSADLAPLALELAAWGVSDAAALRWPSPPPPGALAQARALLHLLGALDEQAHITTRGRTMARLGLHPRLGHMLLEAHALGHGAAACALAALLGERDLLRLPAHERCSDLRLPLELVCARDAAALPPGQISRGALQRARRQAAAGSRRLRAVCGPEPAAAAACAGDDLPGVLLAHAYPDRLARRRAGAGARFVLSGGRGAELQPADPLARADWLVAAELDAGGRDARILRAAPLSAAALKQYHGARIETRDVFGWDPATAAVAARRERHIGGLVLDEQPLPRPDPAALAAALIEGVRALGAQVLPWDRTTRQWQARVQFLRRLDPGQWPDAGDAALLAGADAWLAPRLAGMSRRDDLRRLNLRAALAALLDARQQRLLEELAPAHLVVPSGSRIALDYAAGELPVLAVRLQELFGLRETPRIAAGRVAVQVQILSPAQRPVQVTQDLAGFWAGSYAEVRKALRGRYPKHAWPEDPTTAVAGRGPKRRRD